ncbi:hypothetical protein Acr_28g0001900 [Actinidia rufa]|uniref:Uncharacterized protein n=1 Tax=Actinidia rufa TaxID=165716 RepID=A0A7J0H945_9ERIC|nr:hypothetical protein Acr_28g0001900 [Actinidia rufa]
MTTFETRLDKVEHAMADGQEKFEELGQSIARLEGEGAELRGEMQATLNLVVDDLRKYIDSKYDLVHAEIGAIREEMKEIKGDVSLCKAAAAQVKVKETPKSKAGKGLMYMDVHLNGIPTKAMLDTGASHNFITMDEAKRLGLSMTKGQGWLKAVNSTAKPLLGAAQGVEIHIGPWSGRIDLTVAPMDDFKVVLGMDLLGKVKAVPLPFLRSLAILEEDTPCCPNDGRKQEQQSSPIGNATQERVQQGRSDLHGCLKGGDR